MFYSISLHPFNIGKKCSKYINLCSNYKCMIINEKNGKVIAGKTKICKTALELSRGLMFSSRNEDLGMVLEFSNERKVSLHMFFVFYPIDVVFLDASFKVVEIKKNFMPFTFYNSSRKAKYAVELTAQKSEGAHVGDKIKIR